MTERLTDEQLAELVRLERDWRAMPWNAGLRKCEGMMRLAEAARSLLAELQERRAADQKENP